MLKNNLTFNQLVNKITNMSFVLVAIVSVPLNIVIFLAIEDSLHQFVRYIPPVFSVIAILLAFIRNYLNVKTKIWLFVSFFLAVGAYCLLLGLIDVAGLWFVMVVAFVILIVPRNQAIAVLITTIAISAIAGILLMDGRSPVPFRYDFYNCMVFCVLTRLLHYVVISIIIYYFVNAISTYLKSTILNLENEIKEKKALQNKELETIIKTEEQERLRIAKELHDGLGPVFSTAKLYFQAYADEKDKKSSEEIRGKLEKIFDDAITSISELSRILSPQELTNHGLVSALKAFFKSIEETGKVAIHFKHNDIERLEQTTEFNIYRVIGELTNNSIKHGNPETIKVVMETSEKEFIVTYADNGKGFNVENEMLNNKGMGLHNIIQRIRSNSGLVDFESVQGAGMKAIIKLPLKRKTDIT